MQVASSTEPAICQLVCQCVADVMPAVPSSSNWARGLEIAPPLQRLAGVRSNSQGKQCMGSTQHFQGSVPAPQNCKH